MNCSRQTIPLRDNKKDQKDASTAQSEAGVWSGTAAGDQTPVALSEDELHKLSFTELRDKLLALDPLNRDFVIRINKAEAEYWKRKEGYRVGWSDQILGFDCGGQQWVSEVCFHTGTATHPDTRDLTFMRELLHLIQKERIPAPAPIEQRWTACSSSPLSPASDAVPECIFSWVSNLASSLCSDLLVKSIYVDTGFLLCAGWYHKLFAYGRRRAEESCNE